MKKKDIKDKLLNNDYSDICDCLEIDINDWNNFEDEEITKYLNRFLRIEIVNEIDEYDNVLDIMVNVLSCYTSSKYGELLTFFFSIPSINEIEDIKKIYDFRYSIFCTLAEINEIEHKYIIKLLDIINKAHECNVKRKTNSGNILEVELPDKYNTYASIEKKSYIIDIILALRLMEKSSIKLLKIRLSDQNKTEIFRDYVYNICDIVEKKLRMEVSDYQNQELSKKVREILDKKFQQWH